VTTTAVPAYAAAARRDRPDTGERAYAYAKACGIIGKSFIGKRIPALEKLRSLNEFDRLVFPESSRELPSRELLADLENRILKRTVRHILSIIKSFSEPPELLVRQLRSCEYADVKTCLHFIESGRTDTPPSLIDIGRFGTVRFEKYPDLFEMLTGTEFEFILKRNLTAVNSSEFDRFSLDAELDLLYYTLLAESVRSLHASDRVIIEHVLAEEISLRNCVWAFRLRTYFHKTERETEPHLMDLTMHTGPSQDLEGIPAEIQPKAHTKNAKSGGEISLAAEARESLSLPLDSRKKKKNWRWERLLNGGDTGENWTADPRYFQNAASHYLYRLSLQCFRHLPHSVSAVYCFINLKHFEEDLLTSTAEGLGLGMTGTDIFKLLEVRT
jgi:vacuolar-type H+-ATPase subunit C/Vma6